jgi:mono/diheme cytochrome c family protein
MKTRLLAATGLALGLAAILASTALADKAGDISSIPVAADNFRLIDHTGYAQEMRRLVDVKAIVLVTQVNGDKASRKTALTLAALKAKHPDVEFLMLNSSLKDDRASIAAEAKAQGFSIPVMDDDIQLVGEQLGVSYAGEAFVLQPKTLKVLYHGPVDASAAKKKAKGYLAEALADVSAGKAVAISEVSGKGSAIAFPERAKRAEHQTISYSKDVAPILEAKCVSCHQEGGIGPFAMKSYETVKGFSPMIREAIRTAQMPPWHPDPQVGAFKHSQALSPDQVRKVVHWVEAGSPRGEGPDPLAASARVASEWPLGKPDLILDAPSFTIPPSGEVVYQYPTAANPLKEGRWVRAATLMPGDRRGVHHILAGYIPGEPKKGPASAGQWEANYGEYAVGGESFQVPAGLGIYLPPGGHMGFQMHYTPYGKEAVDNSKMALYFYPEGQKPERIMRHTVIADNFIELPPNKDKHEEIAYLTFPKEARLYSVFLHTHYRGQAGRFDLILPDGTKKALINLPRYDFNWQRTYDFVEPITVPAGAKLVATYLYDNSVRNASNPNPNETVIWGDQSWEEMHYTSIYYEWTDETVAKEADATEEMRTGRLIGMLDDNLDNKVEKSEIKGRIAAMINPRFVQIDTNKDEVLDVAEMKAAAAILPGFGPRRERQQAAASGGSSQ